MYQLSILEIVFLGLLGLSFAVQIYWYARYMHGVARWTKKVKKNKISFTTEQPPVSVIVCAHDEAKNLQNFLPSVLEQNYPEFEVIVVNDSSEDNTEDVLKLFQNKYAHLRTTFVPIGTRIVSSKKLGLNLGIKAAKHEYLLFIDADCYTKSPNWISSMMRNFTPETDIVLGYGAYIEEKTFLNKLITYDTLFIALQYLGMTISKKPYMAVGRNLAYRKSTFLKNGGFRNNLKFRAGDDDLLVNQTAQTSNFRIEASQDSITLSKPKTTLKKWLSQKTRHLSVSPHYTTKSKMRLLVEPISRGTFYLSVILTGCFGEWISWSIGALLLIVLYTTKIYILNTGAKLLATRRFYFAQITFNIYLPLVNLYLLIRNKLSKKTNPIW